MSLHRILAEPITLETIQPIIDSELGYILSSCSPVKVFLFGSASRNEMTDASDLDFLVVVPDDVDLKSIKKTYYCRKKNHTWPVDIVFLRKSYFDSESKVGGVAMICFQEGKVVFEAKG